MGALAQLLADLGRRALLGVGPPAPRRPSAAGGVRGMATNVRGPGLAGSGMSNPFEPARLDRPYARFASLGIVSST